MSWHQSYQLGLSEMIYELGPNTRRNKKKLKKCQGNQHSRQQRAGKMLCVWQAPPLVCSCFALSCLPPRTKPNKHLFPNRKEVVGRGLRGGARASGSRAALGQSRGHRARPRQSREAPTCLALNVLGVPRGRLGCV